MPDPSLLRRAVLRLPSFAAASSGTRFLTSFHEQRVHYATTTTTNTDNGKKKDKWFTLPPFTSSVDGSALGKELSGRSSETKDKTTTSITAVKWVLKCCPQLPRSLIQKLFRLRQVRRESSDIANSDLAVQAQDHRPKRLAAKDSMNIGDRIFLPIAVQKYPSEKAECLHNEEEMKFLHSLELYKDAAIIAINKPPGVAVQGGIGIKRSLDELAAAYMRYDYPEPPRLLGIY